MPAIRRVLSICEECHILFKILAGRDPGLQHVVEWCNVSGAYPLRVDNELEIGVKSQNPFQSLRLDV